MTAIALIWPPILEHTMVDTPATPAPAPLPTKPASQSVSVWAGIAAFVLGLLVQFGLISQDLASAIGANLNDVIGAIMTLVGVVGVFGALRRKTLLSF